MSESLETSIIWGILRQKRDDLIEKLNVEYFRFPRNQKLFSILKAGARDWETIKTACRNVGLRNYEFESLAAVRPVDDIEKAIETLEEGRTIGDVAKICNDIYEKRTDLTLVEIKQRLEKALDVIREKTQVGATKTISQLRENLSAFFQSDSLNGITLGLERLDVVLAPIFYGRYVLIGARPSVGKTALMLQMANQLAKQGNKVAIFSLEQTDWQILARLVSMNFQIPFNEALERLRSEFDETFDQLPHLQNIFLDCVPFKTIDEGIERIRALNVLEGVKVWFLDYLQLIRGNFQNAELFTANCSQAIKAVIKETQTIGFVLSQLNRQSETRSDFEARLSDLRYSGALEQDADIVILLSKLKDDETKRRISIAKNRDGRTLTFITPYVGDHFTFVLEAPKFEEAEPEEDELFRGIF